jgi:hypothetical protein
MLALDAEEIARQGIKNYQNKVAQKTKTPPLGFEWVP